MLPKHSEHPAGDLFSAEVAFAGVKKEVKSFQDPIAEYLDIAQADSANAGSAQALDLSYLSDEQKAESMWTLYTEALRLRPRSYKEEPAPEEKNRKTKAKKQLTIENKRKLQVILSALKELHANEAVREIYLKQFAREKQEKDDINGRYLDYRGLTRQIAAVETEVNDCARRIFGSRGRGVSEIDVLLFESSRRQLDTCRSKRAEVLENSGELAAFAHYEILRGYANDLRRENFIWSTSRRQLLEQLEDAAFSGQPVLLSGESGTGKTRLAEQAALRLTGQMCNVTPGKDTRFQDLVAKPKISPSGETYFEYKEIGEAFTGRSNSLQVEPEHQGRIVADDEFNLLESAEQTGRLARVAAWTPGKKVRMPVTNQEITVAPNSGYWAMVNLASERYERKKIPPEVLRKFTKVDVGYPPQSADNPELYEMMLSALIDANGRLRAAESEVIPEYKYTENEEVLEEGAERKKVTVRTRQLIKNKIGVSGAAVEAGGFLWRFANAMGELNKSFSHQETILKSKGEGQFVRDLIIDMGKILDWLKQYAERGKGRSLEAFIVEKLQKQFLNQKAYSADDQNLIKEFLRAFGIDVAAALATEPEFKNLSPVEVGLLSPRVEYRKIIKQEIEVGEGSYIEADGTRVEYALETYDFKGKEIKPGTILKGSDGKRIKYIGVRKDNGQPVFSPAGEEERGKPKKSEKHRELSEIIRSFNALKDGLNNRARELGVKPPEMELPPLPAELTAEHLKVFGEFLGENFDVSVVPDIDNWDEYMRLMYPVAQQASDTQKGLTASRPDSWEKEINASIVGGQEKYGAAYIRSISAEATGLAGMVFFTESVQKPNYIDGSQKYGSKDGCEDGKDLLVGVIQEVLGDNKNRFSNNWNKVNAVAAKVKEKITAALRARRLVVPDFDVIATPAIISNLEMMIRHPENSSTTTYEWSSTPLLRMNNTDNGFRLLVGNFGGGGAACVDDGRRDVGWYDRGFRLSVVLKKS